MSIDQVFELQVTIPSGVDVQFNDGNVKVTGPKGILSRDLSHIPVTIGKRDDKISISMNWPKRRDKAMVGTAAAHIQNMVKGVTKGFFCRLTVVYAHFPMTVKIIEKERKVIVENFSGERTPRVARIISGASVRIEGDEIIVEGISIDAVNGTSANIQRSTEIKDKDQRVFLDGIYISKKGVSKP